MGRTVWNPVLVSIAAAPSFAWELQEQIQQQPQPTPLSFPIPSPWVFTSLSISRYVSSLQLSLFWLCYSLYSGITFLSSFFCFGVLLSCVSSLASLAFACYELKVLCCHRHCCLVCCSLSFKSVIEFDLLTGIPVNHIKAITFSVDQLLYLIVA